jgi:hypothetical protein
MAMRRFAFPALLTLATLAGCSRGNTPPAVDSTGGATAEPVAAPVSTEARQARVMAFEFGKAVDATNRVYGGVTDRFKAGDSVMVSVRTQYAAPGAMVSARVLLGTRTVDSIGGAVGAADTAGVAAIAFRFPKSPAFKPGDYQIEVFLGSSSQGLRPIQITP